MEKKRIFDFVSSSIALFFLWPLFVFVAIGVKLTSPGPVFYRGARIGRYGKEFRIYKFRTMVVNADKIGGPSTSADDPRLTKFGKWLRIHKIDELPQLLNVFKGEMSIVGPRPEVREYVKLMARHIRNAILEIRPGITDFASLWDIHEEEKLAGKRDPEAYYRDHIRPEKTRLQLKYVKERSLGMDLRIIWQTLWKLIKH